MVPKLLFTFHTWAGDEVMVRADDPDQAAKRLQAFLDDVPGAQRYINSIQLWTAIPAHQRYIDCDWSPPSMKQVIRAWLDEGQLAEIVRYGMGSGWPHFNSYSETVVFYDRFEHSIFEVIDQTAEAYGIRDVLQVLAQHSQAEVHTPNQWKQAAVWFAVQEMAREWCAVLERDDEAVVIPF